MEQKDRNEEREITFNCILLMLQLTGMYNTFDSFLEEFERGMKRKFGECTDEDVEWATKALERFAKRNAPKSSKKKNKKSNEEKTSNEEDEK